MNICVVGTGYVGLVTWAVFADLGNEVVCVDNVAKKIAQLQAGQMPIYEPGLEEMVARNVADGRLTFTTDLAAGVRRAVIVFITVGTPAKDTGQTDLAAVEVVARQIAEAMERYTVIVTKSTVPVGTGNLVREVIERHQTTPVPFDVVSNPEFLREGSAIDDTLRPARIVIGAPTHQAAITLLELYAPLAPLDDKTLGVLGLAFKPNTDDMREAKSVEVISRLVERGATVRAYDPVAVGNARALLPPGVVYCESPYAAATDADGVVLVTE